jgi:pimeloyl-ACP methyl ester carboxylesterase
MMAWARRAAVLLVVGLLGTACSGGGNGAAPEDTTTPGDAKVVKETNVEFTGAGKVHLAGTFSVAAGRTKKTPGVLFVPGTSRTDRDGISDPQSPDPIYKDFSQALTAAGMATFRYDRRGVGLSKLDVDQQRLSLDDLVTDARAALAFLSQRVETDGAPVAVVGYDTGGLVAMRAAAAEPKVKSVVLLSTPGRPLVDVLGDGFQAAFGSASANAFRAEVSTLLASGVLPDRNSIRAEHQPVLPPDQDAMLQALYSDDPLNDAKQVKVPALLIVGSKSTTVTRADADRLASGLAGGAQVMVSDNTLSNLEYEGHDVPIQFDPNNEQTHQGGFAISQKLRDSAVFDRVTSFLTTKLGARPL